MIKVDREDEKNELSKFYDFENSIPRFLENNIKIYEKFFTKYFDIFEIRDWGFGRFEYVNVDYIPEKFFIEFISRST